MLLGWMNEGIPNFQLMCENPAQRHTGQGHCKRGSLAPSLTTLRVPASLLTPAWSPGAQIPPEILRLRSMLRAPQASLLPSSQCPGRVLPTSLTTSRSFHGVPRETAPWLPLGVQPTRPGSPGNPLPLLLCQQGLPPPVTSELQGRELRVCGRGSSGAQ